MADELISRQAFIKSQCNSCDGWCDKVDCDCLNCKSEHRCDFIQNLADAPAVDAVEVVRCMDCKYYRDWEDGDITCAFWTIQWDVSTEPDGFCRYGERRGENGR